ncbi:MAG: helix-turn-helix transcriptional regulator [Clostridia bacterium]|nr:helix-turn-helix transcriptional regulator [Clostridia bacterium]
MNIAQNIKQMRKEMGLTQKELAERVGVTQQCVSDWENGKIEPTISYVAKMSKIFETTIDSLVFD